MVWLPDDEKKTIEDTITRSDRIHERDGQTDGRRTDGRTPHDGIGRACIASRGLMQILTK